jgi:hypothetical protein
MASDPKRHVLAACRVLLRPIVRLLLNSGVTWKEFAEVAKTSFVEVATDEFGLRGRPTNVSRVTILTGINRHDVARQREAIAASGEQAVSAWSGAATRVLSGWHQDPDYLDAAGQPLELPTAGPGSSFETLCARFGGDLPWSALLKELRAVGAIVDGTATGRVRAAMRNYIPVQFDAEKVSIGAHLLQDHGNTVVYDLLRPAGAPARLARRAHNARIETRRLPRFHAFLEREGQAFLERVDDWLTQNEAPAGTPERSMTRVGAGLYQIQDESTKGNRS